MAFLAALPLIGKVLGPVIGKAFGIIDQMVEDKDQAARLKAAIQMQIMEIDHKEFMSSLQEQASIIKAEATGHSWLQRNWRPILMLVIVAIVANNYLLFPYLSMFTDKTVILELPDKLWTLMTLGVGGYIGGRTVEKAAGKVTEILKK
jgi:predicted MFS family arabinose efflux permease